MNEQLDTVNAGASFFEAFLHDHPIASAFIVATLVSWLITAAAKPWTMRGPNRARNLRTFDCAIAGVVAALMLHGQFGWRWITGLALLIAGASPILYFIGSELLCWWKPGLRRFLTLQELTLEDDSNIPSGEGQ